MGNQEEKLLINTRYGEFVKEMLRVAIPAEPNIGKLAGLFDEGRFCDLSALKNKYGGKWVTISSTFEEYLMRSGGKRQRSFLALSGYKTFSGRKQLAPKIIDTVVGVEFLHETALILDDVMDNSTTRRGAPSLWVDIATHLEVDINDAKKIAVNLGPLCFAWARRLIVDESGEKIRASLGEVFWHAVNEMKRGQVLDFNSAVANNWPELEEAIEWEYLKTATYSIELPLLVALHSADVPESNKEKIIENIKIFARSFGLAFQLCDDLLIFKTSEEIGKDNMADAVNGNKIPLAIIARQLGSDEQKKFLDLVWGSGNKLTVENAEKLKNVFRGTGALKVIRQRISEEIKNAEDTLQKIKELGFDTTLLDYLIETGRGRCYLY